MKAYYTYGINKAIVYCNLIYFITGALLFLLLLIEKVDFLVGIALVFFILANIANAFMLLIVILSMLFNLKDFEQHLFALLIALLNYPIALLFIYLLT